MQIGQRPEGRQQQLRVTDVATDLHTLLCQLVGKVRASHLGKQACEHGKPRTQLGNVPQSAAVRRSSVQGLDRSDRRAGLLVRNGQRE